MKGHEIIEAAQKMVDAWKRLNAKLRPFETVGAAYVAGRITAADRQAFLDAYAGIKALGWSDPAIDGIATDLLN